MPVAVLFNTKYGSTKKYAEWIGKELKIKVFEFSEFKSFKKYDCLLIMSGTYAGRMPLVDFMKSNYDKIKDKNITVVSVGMAPENNLWSKISYFLIPGKIKKIIRKYFKLPGQMEGKPKLKKSNINRVISYMRKK